ncbi:unnamed protein product [Paramecium pentaurelia]|uniref:Cytochrome b5 heme-binding domain-containing protein n=1 Tax=Paramecium pentaurelia TaxID=43138 RepID=A0A8S1SKV6_9CILI|nr:unnamed protein product [Paramecium pentaurelia]
MVTGKSRKKKSKTRVPSKLSYILGKIYDLSKFLSLHPGGDYFLSLAQNQRYRKCTIAIIQTWRNAMQFFKTLIFEIKLIN